jgi:hypothetical protein
VKAGLKLPIVLHGNGPERDGGVYYAPGLATEGDTKGRSLNKETNRPSVIFILLGPKAVQEPTKKTPRSLEFTRGALFHEFQHYTRFQQFRDLSKDEDKDVQDLKTEEAFQQEANSEVEATSTGLAGHMAGMSDAEVKSLLDYLAKYWNAALTSFQNAAIARLKAVGGGTPDKRARLRGLIKELGFDKKAKGKDPKDLASLFAALQ